MNDEFLTFKLGNEIYGVEITRIREILTYPKVTELPNTKKWVKGVINLRGEVTPIIDLRIRFNIIDNPFYSEQTIIIAVKTNDNRMLGLVVDEVSDVETIEIEKLLPPPLMGTSISAEYLKGLVKKVDKKQDKMIVLMDIDKILDKKEVDSYTI
jgi:purine-binding chemotaxis protein CheW